MQKADFTVAFKALTDYLPFPWQWELFQHFVRGDFPSTCRLPTGLGKTSVIHLWLLALAQQPHLVPRRLVYVVNRRTVVDQSTEEARKLRARLDTVPGLREQLTRLCANPQPQQIPLAISTLRGQYADNREWSADPARPAVIAGTVDMIGSRLLFSGYGCGYKTRPLHAGFLGQDVLLVHDEAHLEPAFQALLRAIEHEQHRCKEFGRFRVMELSATARGEGTGFQLTEEERTPPDNLPDPPLEPIHHVWRRQKARKTLRLHAVTDEKTVADRIAILARQYEGTGAAVLVFVQKVEDVEKVVRQLPRGMVEQLTGTLRGLERDNLVNTPLFRRFLPGGERGTQTVYLVCTSAGEVGVNLSADHLVCDLTPFDSMAQRFGRVNRFGAVPESFIDIVHPVTFEEKKEYEIRRERTLGLLHQLDGDGSPAGLDALDAAARANAFTPTPVILPVTDILLDSWTLTSIRGQLPGRPPVEPYLHGIREWEPPETHVAWREEVEEINKESLLIQYPPEDLLDDFPLKPHELLRDHSSRVFDRLKKLSAPETTPVWIVTAEGDVEVTTLEELHKKGKEILFGKTVLLPPCAGGLENGLLSSGSSSANDVAEQWLDEHGLQRRVRVWRDDPDRGTKTAGMRLVRQIELRTEDDTEEEATVWEWYELARAGDSDGSKTNQRAVALHVHTADVVERIQQIVASLPLSEEVKEALILAARWHDLGKARRLFQRVLGNLHPDWVLLAKSGGKTNEFTEYRHEFGSLLDTLQEAEFQSLQQRSEQQELILHLIAAHHGRGRPHFAPDEAFDPERAQDEAEQMAAETPRRFARLQRRFGRWGLAYLESLLRAADYAASANPSRFVEERS